MRCLVLVKFLEGGSLSPEEFFGRIKSQWSWVNYVPAGDNGGTRHPGHKQARRAVEAICITDYESVEQLAIDLAIMPGAGISNVEVFPMDEKDDRTQAQYILQT